MPTDYNELYEVRKAEFDALYSEMVHFVAEDFRFPDSPLAAIALSKRLDSLIVQALPADKAIGADDKNAMYEVLSRNYQKIDFADREKAKLFRAAVVMLDTYESPTMTAVAAAANHEGKLTRSFLSEFTDAYLEEDAARQVYNKRFSEAATRQDRNALRQAHEQSVDRGLEVDRLALVQFAGDGVQQALIDSSQAEVIRLNTILQKLSDCPAHAGKAHLKKLLRHLESTGGVLVGNETLHGQIDQSPLTAGEAARVSLARFDLGSPSEASLPEGENREDKIRNLIIFMQKNPDICGALSLRGLNLTDVNLSGLNLSGIDLTGADLTGADLTGADLTGADLTGADLTDVILVGATLPKDLRSDFSFKYHGASITSEVLFSEVIGPMRDQHYMASGKIAPNFGNIFDLLQFIQENPKNDFAKKLDHALMLCAIRHTAKPVVASTDVAPLDVDSYAKAYELSGLGQNQLCDLMKAMHFGFPVDQGQGDAMSRPDSLEVISPASEGSFSSDAGEALTDTVTHEAHESGIVASPAVLSDITVSRYTAKGDVLITLHEKTLHDSPTRRVINVVGALNEKTHTADCPDSHVDSLDFARILNDIALMRNADASQKTVDCIQMPLAAGGDRKHFLHLQIFKKEDGIGVRIIDSTTNHPWATVPDKFVQAVLGENAATLKKILGADTKKVYPVSVVRTNEQMRPDDKKCPLYVSKGIEATTEALLSKGPCFLPQDTWAKNTVRHQHHLVSKTDEMALVFQMAVVKPPIKEPKDELVRREVSSAVRSSSDDHDRLDTSLLTGADVSSGSAQTLSESGDTESDFDDIADHKEVSGQCDKIAPYRKIEELLGNLKSDGLKEAVKAALESYIKERGGFSTFFRQLGSAGKDYAEDALKRLERDPREALRVIREILHTGVQKDGQLEVKNKSRVHYLLKVLEEKGFVSTREPAHFSNVGVMGIKVGITDMSATSSGPGVAEERSRSSRLSM